MKNNNFLRIPINRIIALILLDIMSIIVASVGALYIRFDFNFSSIPVGYFEKLENIIAFNIIVTLVFFALWKLYKSVWRYASATELLNIIFATTCAAIAQVILCYILDEKMPRSYYVIYWALLFAMTSAIRFSYRILRLINSKRTEFTGRKKANNVMLIGAGAAANSILKEIESSQYLSLNVKCIIDDHNGCHGKFLRGVPIIGGRDKIIDAVGEYNIDEIIFAIPSANTKTKKEILDICKETGCKLRTLPGMYQLINGDVSVAKLKEVEIEDLLGREPIQINTEEVLNYVKDKVVLVTGGGGSIGSELCRQIASHQPKQLIIVDIYENNAYDIQLELQRKYPKLNLETMIASVRDQNKINNLFAYYHPDIVYHAAAHKHVPLMEDAPHEAIKNNVFGTLNVAKAADQYGVKKFILILTNKAVNPTNIMGASKRLCEMIVQSFDKKSKTEFVAVRFGNVLGSNGSVIPLFKKQIKAGGPVTVTHPEITRFFMTIPEAAQLVLQAAAYAKGGEIFVLDMGKPVKIYDLARKMIYLSGLKPDEDIKIKFTGLRAGEKLYEELIMDEEKDQMQLVYHDKIFVTKPIDMDYENFENNLQKLKNSCEKDAHAVKLEIKKIVPNYNGKDL